MATLTLDKMADGGMYDQVGGGFHRYSTDDHWLVPHFEKMLYDNALLARVYLDAYRSTQKPLYRRVAEETLDFVIREMRDPNGAFYSTQDADSEGVEGKYYVWSLDEFRQVVGDDATQLADHFDVTEHGNWEENNILNIRQEADPAMEDKIGAAKKKLYAARLQRVKPGRDEKVLTDWNGLMLRAFAEAAAFLGRSDYRDVAESNANFLLSTMWDGTRLVHSYKDGRARFNAYLDDYANLTDGLVALYELTLEAKWLDAAVRIADRMIEQFWDSAGGFYFTSQDHESLLTRTKDFFDNATPSGNSVASDVLLRLAAILERDDYRKKAEDIFLTAASLMKQYASGFGRMLAALDFYLGPSKEIVFAGSPEPFLEIVRKRYLPRTVVLRQDRPMIDGKPTVYLCENFTCKQPTTDVRTFEEMLANGGLAATLDEFNSDAICGYCIVGAVC